MRILWFWLLLVQASSALAEHEPSSFVIELWAENSAVRSEIAKVIHIDSIVGDRVYSVVNYSDLKQLKRDFDANILAVEVLDGNPSEYFQPMAAVLDFPAGEEAFHTYDEMTAELRTLENRNPGLVEMFSIGKSLEGREIWALKITDESRGKPLDDRAAIAYMGTHHAREHISTEVPIIFAKDLIDMAGTDSAIKALLQSTIVYVIPMVNPDGSMFDIEGRRYHWWRKNRHRNADHTFGVDLNRNYGHGWGTGGSSTNPSSDVYMGTAPFSEPETQSIRDFFLAHRNVKIALTLHTFSELILYPWGGLHEGVGGEDEAIFKKMASDMAAMNHYRPMQSSELYIASGDTCDWLYGDLSVYCFTFELSPSSMWEGGFYPGASVIDKVYRDNLPPMLYLAHLAQNPAWVLSN